MGRSRAVPGKAGDLLKVTQDVSSRVGAEHVPSAQVSCWEVLILLLTWHDCCKWDYRHYRLREINEPLKELELLKWPYIIRQQAASHPFYRGRIWLLWRKMYLIPHREAGRQSWVLLHANMKKTYQLAFPKLLLHMQEPWWYFQFCVTHLSHLNSRLLETPCRGRREKAVNTYILQNIIPRNRECFSKFVCEWNMSCKITINHWKYLIWKSKWIEPSCKKFPPTMSATNQTTKICEDAKQVTICFLNSFQLSFDDI